MKRKQKLTLVAVLTFASICISASVLNAQQFDLSWFTIASGGGYADGGTFELEGTIGQHEAGPVITGGSFELTGGFGTGLFQDTIILGDVNLDGAVNLLDVAPFIDRLGTGTYQAEADVNGDGVVNLLDVDPFISQVSGG